MKEASVASELDFNHENASVTFDSDEKDSIDLNEVQNLTELRAKEIGLPSAVSVPESLPSGGIRNNLGDKFTQLHKGKT